MVKRIRGIGAILLAVVLMVLAAKGYLGFHYYYKYEKVRANARSIESSFPELEGNLKKAVGFSKNPLFFKELARLYLERALAENQFGTPERRDFFIDQMRESLIQLIRRNPIDAFAYYEMGKVYLFYNFPLLTYFDKAKLYFQKALELKPADGFLNMNIIYIFMTQWDFLIDEDRNFVFERVRKMWSNNESFIPRLRNRWKKETGDPEKIKEILSQDGELWKEIGEFF